MKIVWESDNTTLYAVAYGEIINGYYHEELMFAEIDDALGGFMVRFEDDWSNPQHCTTQQEAKEFVIRNHSRHTPRSMRRNYFMG